MGPNLGVKALQLVTPTLTYAVQPMGVEVAGNVALQFALPPDPEGFEYTRLPETCFWRHGSRFAQLVPVGVGLVDKQARSVRSAGVLALRRLDFVTMTPISGEAAQALLARYVAGEITLTELTSALEGMR